VYEHYLSKHDIQFVVF